MSKTKGAKKPIQLLFTAGNCMPSKSDWNYNLDLIFFSWEGSSLGYFSYHEIAMIIKLDGFGIQKMEFLGLHSMWMQEPISHHHIFRCISSKPRAGSDVSVSGYRRRHTDDFMATCRKKENEKYVNEFFREHFSRDMLPFFLAFLMPIRDLNFIIKM